LYSFPAVPLVAPLIVQELAEVVVEPELKQDSTYLRRYST